MSFLSDLFGATTNTTESKVKLPGWVEDSAKWNLNKAGDIAAKPYTPYNLPRITPFSGDSTAAQGALRNYQMPNMNSTASGGSLPRLIDDVGPGGSVKAYMDPYVDQVIERAMGNVRRSADMGQQNLNSQAHAAGAFGDARHGVAQGQIEGEAMRAMGDQAASLSSQAYGQAQDMRNMDINRMLQGSNQNLDQMLRYVDALMKSGGWQEQKTQQSLDLAKGDFDRQQQYPTEMLNLMMSALSGTPYGKTTQQQTPGPSVAGQALGTLGSLLGLFV
jgi:hypothetical protein